MRGLLLHSLDALNSSPELMSILRLWLLSAGCLIRVVEPLSL